jgi:hypothetical protein
MKVALAEETAAGIRSNRWDKTASNWCPRSHRQRPNRPVLSGGLPRVVPYRFETTENLRDERGVC